MNPTGPLLLNSWLKLFNFITYDELKLNSDTLEYSLGNKNFLFTAELDQNFLPNGNKIYKVEQYSNFYFHELANDKMRQTVNFYPYLYLIFGNHLPITPSGYPSEYLTDEQKDHRLTISKLEFLKHDSSFSSLTNDDINNLQLEELDIGERDKVNELLQIYLDKIETLVPNQFDRNLLIESINAKKVNLIKHDSPKK
ncbi:MAG: hypothetical protein H0U57_02350 [Tatlockia sp.]|nr:hypothetical protein [Tatlockia sp.]